MNIRIIIHCCYEVCIYMLICALFLIEIFKFWCSLILTIRSNEMYRKFNNVDVSIFLNLNNQDQLYLSNRIFLHRNLKINRYYWFIKVIIAVMNITVTESSGTESSVTVNEKPFSWCHYFNKEFLSWTRVVFYLLLENIRHRFSL